MTALKNFLREHYTAPGKTMQNGFCENGRMPDGAFGGTRVLDPIE
jgi:hypothetical protein